MPNTTKHQFNSYLSDTLFEEQSETGASKKVNVTPYLYHSVQVIYTSGTPSIEIRTSLDGTNWYVEQTVTEAGIYTLEGKTRFISVNYSSGSGTAKVLLLSSN